ncbi:MAG: cell division protein SepF [Clostridia bacterium]|nr:cell division protein SepF [Clostridia bacterium]
MGLFEKIKKYVTAEDEDYDDEPIEAPVTEMKKKVVKTESKPSYISDRNEKSNKVLNIHTTAQLQVILVKPDRFDDAANVADHLREKHTVVLNLESTNKDVSRRLVDFLSGVAYALDGQIKKVANSTFIITPYNVDIMGDLIDELSSTGVLF